MYAEKYRDEDEADDVKIEAKNRLQNCCIAARNTHTEEKLEGKCETGDEEKCAKDALDQVNKNPLAEKVEFEAGHTEKSVRNALVQVDKFRLAEKDEFEAKQKELRVVGKVPGIPVVVRRQVRTIQGAQQMVARQTHSSSWQQSAKAGNAKEKQKEEREVSTHTSHVRTL